jgi:hypothetical protein
LLQGTTTGGRVNQSTILRWTSKICQAAAPSDNSESEQQKKSTTPEKYSQVREQQKETLLETISRIFENNFSHLTRDYLLTTSWPTGWTANRDPHKDPLQKSHT